MKQVVRSGCMNGHSGGRKRRRSTSLVLTGNIGRCGCGRLRKLGSIRAALNLRVRNAGTGSVV